jgi:hypothetical protein
MVALQELATGTEIVGLLGELRFDAAQAMRGQGGFFPPVGAFSGRGRPMAAGMMLAVLPPFLIKGSFDGGYKYSSAT